VKANTGSVWLFGPVNGMDELDAEGSYFRLAIIQDGKPVAACLISRDSAETLRDELVVALSEEPRS